MVTEPTRAPAGQDDMSTRKQQETSFSHNKKNKKLNLKQKTKAFLAPVYYMLVFLFNSYIV